MPSPDLSGMIQRCEPSVTIERDTFTLENNAWGANQVSTFSQCVYASVAGSPNPRYGWTWNYPEELPDAVKAYPEIIYGKKPWFSTSTTLNLPRLLSPIPSLTVDFDLQHVGTGRYNTAFELWLTSQETATAQQISHEVMFWIGAKGQPRPAGSYETTVTFPDGRRCDLWLGEINTWNYLAFYFHVPFTSGVLEFGYYLDYLVRNNWLPPNCYIASLELGNEVWYGTGTSVLERYQVTLNSTLVIPPPNPPSEPVVPPVEPMPVPPVVTPPASDPTKAVIEVEVPTAALVYVEEHLMQSTSSHRVFASPSLSPNQDFYYTVRVVLEEPDRYVEERRKVIVRAGVVVRLSFLYLAGTNS